MTAFDLHVLTAAALIGIGATMFMDLAAIVQRRVFAMQTLDYAMVGRWIGHVLRGQVIHRPIAASPALPGETAIGWGVHYLTGASFAAAFLALAGRDWLASPSLLPALGFGAVTVLVPYLILQPGLGAGLAARCTPNPTLARARSLLSHLIFGFGLWVAGMALSALTQAG